MRKLAVLTLMLFASMTWSLANTNSTPLKKASPPAISYTTNSFVDYSGWIYINCTGEWVYIEGPLHILSHVTINNNTIVIKNHYQPQGISGSSESGVPYRAVGVSQEIYKGTLANGQASYTSINNFRIIGQGPGNNYTVHTTIHYTFNANGEVTAEVLNNKVDCK